VRVSQVRPGRTKELERRQSLCRAWRHWTDSCRGRTRSPSGIETIPTRSDCQLANNLAPQQFPRRSAGRSATDPSDHLNERVPARPQAVPARRIMKPIVFIRVSHRIARPPVTGLRHGQHLHRLGEQPESCEGPDKRRTWSPSRIANHARGYGVFQDWSRRLHLDRSGKGPTALSTDRLFHDLPNIELSCPAASVQQRRFEERSSS